MRSFVFENLYTSHLSPKRSQWQKGQWHGRGQWWGRQEQWRWQWGWPGNKEGEGIEEGDEDEEGDGDGDVGEIQQPTGNRLRNNLVQWNNRQSICELLPIQKYWPPFAFLPPASRSEVTLVVAKNSCLCNQFRVYLPHQLMTNKTLVISIIVWSTWTPPYFVGIGIICRSLLDNDAANVLYSLTKYSAIEAMG